MPYNLRSRKNRRVKGNVPPPPPEESSSSGSESESEGENEKVKLELIRGNRSKKWIVESSEEDESSEEEKVSRRKSSKKQSKEIEPKGANRLNDVIQSLMERYGGEVDSGSKKKNRRKYARDDESEDDEDEEEESETEEESEEEVSRRRKKKAPIKKKSSKSKRRRVIEESDDDEEDEDDNEGPTITLQLIFQGDDEDYDEDDEDYDDDDEDDDEDDDDEDEEGGFAMLFNGMRKKNPYNIRLPAKQLTPELLEYLQKMPKVLGSAPKQGEDIAEFRSLDKEKQLTIVKALKEITDANDKKEHPYFHILSLPIDAESKRVALERQVSLMDAENSYGGGDNAKAQNWLRGFLTIPFGKYRSPPQSARDDPAQYLNFATDVMDKETYGMNDAKEHILRYIAQLITNPEAAGNCLAFVGPPGTGKTSLIRNGLGQILNRPVHLIALGGNTDSSTLEGHSYTYEGSLWGQIVDILMRSKCMNPVIVFDELDKVSATAKGDEIIGILTHITDSTQNTAFQDKYFAGINIDLSRVLFVFTLNHRESVNPVLMDRLRLIHTKGYSQKEKRIIGEEYLLPRILKEYGFGELKISNEGWNWILEERKEDGVRNLKRDLETIVSRLNILQLCLEHAKKVREEADKKEQKEKKKLLKKQKRENRLKKLDKKRMGKKDAPTPEENAMVDDILTKVETKGTMTTPGLKAVPLPMEVPSEMKISSPAITPAPAPAPAPAPVPVAEPPTELPPSVSTSAPTSAPTPVLPKTATPKLAPAPTPTPTPVPEIKLPKGVPKGIRWKKGDVLDCDDIKILLESRNMDSGKLPFGMYM